MARASLRRSDSWDPVVAIVARKIIATRQAIITPDVIAEPRWKIWLWLAKEFDYRACWSFPIETSAGKLVGTFAMYYKDPTEATPPDLDLASTLTRTASRIISRHHNIDQCAGVGADTHPP